MSVEDYFAPLGKQYCLYFYVLSVFGAICVLMALIGGVYVALVQKNNMNAMLMVMYGVSFGIFYFKSRLLYTMCAHTTH
jgi:uncharacterized membrane protein